MSRLNLLECEEEDTAYVEKIINAVGLEYEADIEILEFDDMINATEAPIEEPVPFELNSFEFFFKLYRSLRVKQREHLAQANRTPLPRLKAKTLDLRPMQSKVKF